MTTVAAPVLSIVVPSVNGWPELEGCLDALAAAAHALPCEALIPERCGDDVRARIAARMPAARVLPVAAGTTIPQMRAAAFAAATAPTVVVIEDHVHVPDGWAQRILAQRAAGHRVIGGVVENAATATTTDWAAFLCEYSGSLSARSEGPAEWITGNNTAYDRALLAEFAPVIAEGRWENTLHDAFRAAGIVLWHDPLLVAGHRKHYAAASDYAGERYTYARAWGAMHGREAGALARLARGVATIALPPLLLARIVARTWPHRALRGRLLASLPLLAYFVVAWAVGEWAGAWFGDGGALARVR
jgi:hypothetical protein